MSSPLILVGLGNPTPRYEWTRHNLGFHVADGVARRCGARWRAEERSYLRADGAVEGRSLILIKPQTYVNRTGQALLALERHDDVDASDLLTVVDDIALPWGRLRLRRRGSHGGHNGLRSIIEALGTAEFPRLRIGVGPVPDEEDPADFVLEPLPRDLRDSLGEVTQRAIDCIVDIVVGGFDRAMSLHNVAGESD